MNKRVPSFIFLFVCIVLALLLVFEVIPWLISGVIFAVALVMYGVVSAHLRKNTA
jgi:uncharacterized RDD family membrane protein YckC